MATERVSMRKAREILRLRGTLGLSHRQAARSLGLSVGAVGETLRRARRAGLDWAQAQGLTDEELERRLYGPPITPSAGPRPAPDCQWVHTERRRPGVTLALLHLEYLEKHPGGYRYTQFCEFYRRWLKRRRLSMRQLHRAGEKTFTDYAGKKPRIVNPRTGEVHEVELFVAALGASNFTFAEATLTQQSADWISSHVHTFEYFGGVSAAVVPDQLKSGVTRACRYEPTLQRTYEEMARHYGTTILPARPAHPKDKAKAEVAVQVAERWILARLRNDTFFSLGALNTRIAELREELNARPMRLYGASRRELFEHLDRPALRPLPPERFTYAQWKLARVNIDYHIELHRHFYSVPHRLVGEQVEARVSATTVEVFHRSLRVASHPRDDTPGRHTTVPEHMPKAHQKHLAWSPSRFIRWGERIGPNTARLVQALLTERPHPEQGYRSCLGILRLARRYGPERLERACVRALAVRARSYRSVESILKHGLDRAPLPEAPPAAPHPPRRHENLRGQEYYH
jgi:transposase